MFTAFRALALTTLVTCPPAYFALKAAAYGRHHVVNALEGGPDMRHTYHQGMLNYVYPL